MEQENSQLKTSVNPKISSIEDLFRNALELYKKGFQKLIGLMLIGFLATIPIALLFLAWGLFAYFGIGNNISNLIFSLIGVVLFLVSVIYIAVSAQAGTFLYFKKEYPKPGVFSLFNEARKKYFWPFLWVSLLTGLLVFLGFILLIIPGIILLVYYSLSVWIFIFEEKKGYEALKGSMDLVRGYWWAVAGRLFLVYLIVYIVIVIPGFFINKGTALVMWNSLSQLISFLVAPFFLSYQYLIYKDLVKIKSKR